MCCTLWVLSSVSLIVTVAAEGGPLLSSSEGPSFVFFPLKSLIYSLGQKSTSRPIASFNVYFFCMFV